MRIRLPANDWHPRDDQLPLWDYLDSGGLRAVEIAHRRWGKDEIALNHMSRSMVRRVGTYWHMLPKANQSRKAIWEAVNPRTGKRRIDEAFPEGFRSDFRESDMFLRYKNGSTFQVVGSDNYDNLVGSPPIGLTLSEWALADPHAWAMLRPILDENGGYALFITTPRGRNHALNTLKLARETHGWFAEVLDATKTPVFTKQKLAQIKRELIVEWGEEDGASLFDQEYMCSFDAPLIGAFYAKIIGKLEAALHCGLDIPHVKSLPVETAWDLGYADDTAIWFYQIVRGEPRILHYYSNHNKDIEHYAKYIEAVGRRRGWKYWFKQPQDAMHWVPWDARPKTLASGGKSLLEIAWNDCQLRLRVAPNLSKADGIKAVRKILPKCWFDKEAETGLECLRNYRREWDDDRKVFSDDAVHDWTSHGSDAFRILAVAQRQREEYVPVKATKKTIKDYTVDELFALNERYRDDD